MLATILITVTVILKGGLTKASEMGTSGEGDCHRVWKSLEWLRIWVRAIFDLYKLRKTCVPTRLAKTKSRSSDGDVSELLHVSRFPWDPASRDSELVAPGRSQESACLACSWVMLNQPWQALCELLQHWKPPGLANGMPQRGVQMCPVFPTLSAAPFQPPPQYFCLLLAFSLG